LKITRGHNRKQTKTNAPTEPNEEKVLCLELLCFDQNLMIRDRQLTLVSVQKVNDSMTHGERLRTKKKKI